MLTIKLNENTNSGMLYAIAYCEDPDIYSEDFWGWDTESDVGYELMEFGSLIQDADVFDSLEAAEDRADDVLSSIFENEVFIVGLDPYTPHNLTGFVKKITRESINESKSINESADSYDTINFNWSPNWIGGSLYQAAFITCHPNIDDDTYPYYWGKVYYKGPSFYVASGITEVSEEEADIVTEPLGRYYDVDSAKSSVEDWIKTKLNGIEIEEDDSEEDNNEENNNEEIDTKEIEDELLWRGMRGEYGNYEDTVAFKMTDKAKAMGMDHDDAQKLAWEVVSQMHDKRFDFEEGEALDESKSIKESKYSDKYLDSIRQKTQWYLEEHPYDNTFDAEDIASDVAENVFNVDYMTMNNEASYEILKAVEAYLDEQNLDESKSIKEGYELLGGSKVEVYSDYDIAKKRAKELGLKEAEYGDSGKFSYCYWNETGDRNDEEQVIAYYTFENGKPRPLTPEERDIVAREYVIDYFDNDESKSIKESGISEVEPVVKFKGKSSHTFTPDKKWEVDFDEEGNVLARTRQGKPYYFSGHINDKTNEFGHTDEDAIIQAAREQHKLKFGKLTSRKNESKSIKESAIGDYIEVAYICDGFTNFRVFGGGFKTSDALVSVEDEKGKRLRLTMGDVCEFYTWYDAKGNVIHEPGYIDTDADYKGIKTITLNADAEGQKIVLTFDTFEDVYKHFENLYMNATDENYAEEILYSIMCSASANEYDYIDEDGFAIIEVDATGIFN